MQEIIQEKMINLFGLSIPQKQLSQGQELWIIGGNEEMMKGIFFIEECKKRSQIITRDITSQMCKRRLSSICSDLLPT
jgi:hypothetical protein